uniref:Variant surface glycoprotein 804 n=1 Tax=Trypanosoma brucei TaxID=5691 RepID=M4SXT7_9TRYP|nr:variant surface glycoprotein 804 [Trypanosoma brucei]
MFPPLHGSAFIPTLLLLTTVESSGPALKGAEIAKLCKLSKFLATIPGDSIDKISTAVGAIRAAADANFKATLATLAAKNETATLLYAALAKITADCLDAQVTKAGTLVSTTTEASARAAATAAAVSEFVHFLKKASAGGTGTGYCLTTTTTGDASIFTETSELDCDSLQFSFNGKAANYDSSIINNKGFPLLSGSDTKSTGSSSKCILYHKSGGGADPAEVFQSPTPVALAGGTLTVTPASGSPAAATATANNYDGDWSEQAGDKIKALYSAIAKQKKSSPTVCGATVNDIVKYAVTSNKLHIELEALVKKSKMQLNGKTEAETATNIINTFLKTDGDKGEQLAAQINTAQATIIDGDTVNKGAVNQLDTTQKLSAALAIDLKTARTSALHQQTQLEAALAKLPCAGESAKKTLEDEAEENCNAKDKESDCKKPCKWDGEAKTSKKKCTLSEEGKQAVENKADQETGVKNDKTTNTTGSNSVVIHKATLWLEFLLILLILKIFFINFMTFMKMCYFNEIYLYYNTFS